MSEQERLNEAIEAIRKVQEAAKKAAETPPEKTNGEGAPQE